MFGEVRSLLQASPSVFVWEALISAIEQTPSEQLEAEVMPYIKHHLERWPAALRVLPASWKVKIARGDRVSAASICRELQFRQQSLNTLNSAERAHILEAPDTAEITRLNFHYADYKDEDLKLLSQLDRLAKLEALNLTSNPSLSASGLNALFEAKQLNQSGKLRELRLGACPGLVESIDTFIQSDLPATLSELDVQTTRQSPETLLTLFELAARWGWRGLDVSNHPHLSQGLDALIRLGPLAIESLGVASCGLDDAHLERWLSSGQLNQLKHLDLSRNGLHAEGFRSFSDAADLHLESLKLSNNDYHLPNPYIIPKGFERSYACFEALCQAESLKQLKLLKLRSCAIDEAAIQRLSQARFLPHLEDLNLSSNPLGHTGLLPLLRQPLKRLKQLNVSQCHLRAGAIKAIAECEDLSQLEALDLSANPLQRAGYRALAQSRTLTHLKSLNLSHTDPDEGAIIGLLNAPMMTTVQELGLGQINISDGIIAALARSPYCATIQLIHWTPHALMSRQRRKQIQQSETLHPRLIAYLMSQHESRQG